MRKCVISALCAMALSLTHAVLSDDKVWLMTTESDKDAHELYGPMSRDQALQYARTNTVPFNKKSGYMNLLGDEELRYMFEQEIDVSGNSGSKLLVAVDVNLHEFCLEWTQECVGSYGDKQTQHPINSQARQGWIAKNELLQQAIKATLGKNPGATLGEDVEKEGYRYSKTFQLIAGKNYATGETDVDSSDPCRIPTNPNNKYGGNWQSIDMILPEEKIRELRDQYSLSQPIPGRENLHELSYLGDGSEDPLPRVILVVNE